MALVGNFVVLDGVDAGIIWNEDQSGNNRKTLAVVSPLAGTGTSACDGKPAHDTSAKLHSSLPQELACVSR